jgi:hypothetical protein
VGSTPIHLRQTTQVRHRAIRSRQTGQTLQLAVNHAYELVATRAVPAGEAYARYFEALVYPPLFSQPRLGKTAVVTFGGP